MLRRERLLLALTTLVPFRHTARLLADPQGADVFLGPGSIRIACYKRSMSNLARDLITFNPCTSLTGEQRRAILELSQSRPGWRYVVTPSTGPAQELVLFSPEGLRFKIERDGSWS